MARNTEETIELSSAPSRKETALGSELNLDLSSEENSSGELGEKIASVPASAPSDQLPEGGYAWVIVVACSIIMSFAVGLTYAWGVIQASLARERLASDGTLSFVGSIAASFVAIGAFLNARIIRWIGTRNAGMASVFLLALGQILSSFSTHQVGGLFVTNGVVTGFGVGLGFMTCSALPAQYFLRRRGLANGLVSTGVGIGGAVWSLALNSLINKVGIPWAFRILGIITLGVGLPAAMLLKERTRRISPSLELYLFADWKFFLLFTGCSIGTFPLLVPPFFIPLYATSLNTSTLLASLFLAAFNLSSAVGRVVFGQLCDVAGPINTLLLALALSTLSLFAIWPVSSSLAPFAVFAILNGASNGGFFSTVPSVVGHIYGSARVANALAMVVTGWVFGYILGAPIAGWILTAYGGLPAGHAAFRPAIYYAGSLAATASLLILGMRQLMLKSWKIFAFL